MTHKLQTWKENEKILHIKQGQWCFPLIIELSFKIKIMYCWTCPQYNTNLLTFLS